MREAVLAVEFVDLAKDLIRLSGLSPEQIGISYTGLRPGEKLSEQLYFAAETTVATSHSKLRMAFPSSEELVDVTEIISELLPVLDSPDDVIRDKLRTLLPEYSPMDAVDSSPGPPLERPSRRFAEVREAVQAAQRSSVD